MRPARRLAFTLIELLIVVAIIAILAAIAVPNFLEAQTRSKVARVRADLRAAATALEAYQVDANRYPPTPFVLPSFDAGLLRVLPNVLTSPVAYLTAPLPDPFIAELGDFQAVSRMPDANGQPVLARYAGDPATGFNDPGFDPRAGRRYYYQSNTDRRRSAQTQAQLEQLVVPREGAWVLASLGPDKRRSKLVAADEFSAFIPYDPTNGTLSAGDVVRTQKEVEAKP